jgi:hypothetical protein
MEFQMKRRSKGLTTIGNLQYGTPLRGVQGNESCVYIKVKKTETGVGLSLSYSRQHSVLMNLKTGGLRQIPGDTLVIPLDTLCEFQETVNPGMYEKHSW